MKEKIWTRKEFGKLPFEVINGSFKFDDGDVVWYKDGLIHREDGPAIEYADGHKSWHKNGVHNRDDGHAIEFPNGDKEWWKEDKRHRLDGPAIEHIDGFKLWFIEGKQYSEEEFKIKSFAILNNLQKFL